MLVFKAFRVGFPMYYYKVLSHSGVGEDLFQSPNLI